VRAAARRVDQFRAMRGMPSIDFFAGKLDELTLGG
jgi:hypothetical protein